jgi:hypothetical protein
VVWGCSVRVLEVGVFVGGGVTVGGTVRAR